jgi:hypothetical protein
VSAAHTPEPLATDIDTAAEMIERGERIDSAMIYISEGPSGIGVTFPYAPFSQSGAQGVARSKNKPKTHIT